MQTAPVHPNRQKLFGADQPEADTGRQQQSQNQEAQIQQARRNAEAAAAERK